MDVKPPPDRLYGRQRTHALRPRQQRLLDVTLPRLACTPGEAYGPEITELWLEVGFGGGEHSRAQIAANPHAMLIACEVFEQGLCSLLAALGPKARHAKRRFVHPDIVVLAASRLKQGAEWRVASDDPTYQAWAAEVMAAQNLFSAPPPARDRPEGWPPTRYEAKARAAGRSPLYWVFTRL